MQTSETELLPTQEGKESEPLIIVSLDAHVAPWPSAYRPYCEAKYLNQYDQFMAEVEQHLTMTPATSERDGERPRRYWRDVEEIYGGEDVNADVTTRLASMDGDGVACEAIYHGGFNGLPIPFFSRQLTATFSQDVPQGADARELRYAGIRMYNRFLADYVSVAPSRFLGLAFVPMWDIEASIAEAKWAKEAGLSGLNFPAPRNELLSYNRPEYDSFWATCSDLGLALHTHGGGGTFPEIDEGPGMMGIHASEVLFASRRGLWPMIFGGVFERFPELQLVLTEQMGGWVVDALATMDSSWLSAPQLRTVPYIQDVLPRRPSDYFRTNVSVGASFMSHAEAVAAVEHDYLWSMMWGRDFPHPEGTWPYTAASLRKTFTGIPEDAVRAILGNNAIRVFQLDEAELKEVAAKIGPTIESVLEPLDERPAGSYLSMGFRDVGSWA
jgi:predicted TIM-barrel fold metal-dependent hydrolase